MPETRPDRKDATPRNLPGMGAIFAPVHIPKTLFRTDGAILIGLWMIAANGSRQTSDARRNSGPQPATGTTPQPSPLEASQRR
ncbi:hypothetical protein PSAL_020970 [Pseudooceanicola algae]|uniref:Uncharacterized protein n=1 Tax=Pseudooceanicola algae TaxID=1537215 RepID=A0A418SL50_9RHOB|nr:hypothetical protein PSAL_020970 [Pseudooceanicola algae]